MQRRWNLRAMMLLIGGLGLIMGGLQSLFSPKPGDPIGPVLALVPLLAIVIGPFAVIWLWAEASARGG